MRKLVIIIVIGLVLALLFVISGCHTSYNYPIDGKTKEQMKQVYDVKVFILAVEIIKRGESFHTILFTKDYSDASIRKSIEVNNIFIPVMNGYYILTLVPTEEDGVYTIEKFAY